MYTTNSNSFIRKSEPEIALTCLCLYYKQDDLSIVYYSLWFPGIFFKKGCLIATLDNEVY